MNELKFLGSGPKRSVIVMNDTGQYFLLTQAVQPTSAFMFLANNDNIGAIKMSEASSSTIESISEMIEKCGEVLVVMNLG